MPISSVVSKASSQRNYAIEKIILDLFAYSDKFIISLMLC
jgi:hypothetical protein